ncbi:hypothetical protein BP6252_13731 [Coleophoma cylindrospora]|uniref:Uncharacterized protein n=1 Tax=Coleophoma cylindrospora TaxID=1849047 RepID=A0A3D8Q769_9HELO|nr:hypothetical protein BP6252_13731 [Coleophoma cylindrospora]
MSITFCGYNCSERPTIISPYADISGIGVIIGYVTTAGIAVTVIAASFVTIHNPTEDPFQKKNDLENGIQSSQVRPNPVDAMFLSHFGRRRSKPRLKNACLKPYTTSNSKRLRYMLSLPTPSTQRVHLGLSDILNSSTESRVSGSRSETSQTSFD